MSAFTSSIGPQIERFLTHKRALGRAYHREEAFLRELDCFALREQSDFVSESLVRIYLSTFSQRARPSRLTLIHQLARFLVFEEPRTFIPSTRFLGIRRQRPGGLFGPGLKRRAGPRYERRKTVNTAAFNARLSEI